VFGVTIILQKGRRKSWHTAKIVDSDEDSAPLQLSPAVVLSHPPDVSLPPISQPWDHHPASSHVFKVTVSTEEGKTSGSTGEKIGQKDAEVEGRKRSQAKGRRVSRRKKKKEKRDGNWTTFPQPMHAHMFA
jgi:hypothetical protein